MWAVHDNILLKSRLWKWDEKGTPQLKKKKKKPLSQPDSHGQHQE